MGITKRLFIPAVVLALMSIVLMTGCSLFVNVDTPSSTVQNQVRQAESAYLVAITIINVRANGKVSPDVQAAEAIVYTYISEAKKAADSGDAVTANQKLDLFNKSLLDFNQRYVTPVPSTQP